MLSFTEWKLNRQPEVNLVWEKNRKEKSIYSNNGINQALIIRQIKFELVKHYEDSTGQTRIKIKDISVDE